MEKILNPATGRMVSVKTKLGKSLLVASGKAPEGKIYNPATKRFVKADSALGRRLAKGPDAKPPMKRVKKSAEEKEYLESKLAIK